MRTLITIPLRSLAALTMTLTPGCSSTQTAETSSAPNTKAARADITPIAADRATMRVNGMSCPKCANNIERQLTALAGVEGVDIDLGSGVVTARFAKGTTHPSRAQLAKAIDNTGFTLVSIDTAGG